MAVSTPTELRDLIARALYEHQHSRGPLFDDLGESKDIYLARADAVLALGVVRVEDVVAFLRSNGERNGKRLHGHNNGFIWAAVVAREFSQEAER